MTKTFLESIKSDGRTIMHANNGTTSNALFDFFDLGIQKEKEQRMNHYLINMDDQTIIARFEDDLTANEIGRTSKFGYLVISKEEDLKQITVPLLNKIRKNLDLKNGANKAAALSGLWMALEAIEFSEPTPVPKKKKKKDAKPKGPSRRDKILALFKENDGVITKDEIAKSLGIKSPSSCMAGLANPVKTKEPVLVTYDKENQTYTLTGHDKDEEIVVVVE